jgi:hypothetical protein
MDTRWDKPVQDKEIKRGEEVVVRKPIKKEREILHLEDKINKED